MMKSIAAVTDACCLGDLASLQKWKADGILPDLMKTADGSRRPHEAAAKEGKLEVLKWLVFDSGQSIDLSSDSNHALRRADAHGYPEVVDWIINDSRQIYRLKQVGKIDDILSAYERPESTQFDLFLEEQCNLFRQRCSQLQNSQLCREAFGAKLATTMAELEKLITTQVGVEESARKSQRL